MAARRLLVTGPIVGACWGVALIINHAWAWPVPAGLRFLLGAALISVIGLLAVGAFSRRYRSAGRAGAAGCAGITALDVIMVIAIMLAAPAVIWPIVVAAVASAARITFTAHPAAGPGRLTGRSRTSWPAWLPG
jgi:hypothetical protein